MSSVPDQRQPSHDDLAHPRWEVDCEVSGSGVDVYHWGALFIHDGRHGTVVVSRVRADELEDDGQTTHEHEVWVEPVGDGCPREVYAPADVEPLAVLAEAEGDDNGRALAALLRDLGRDDA